MFRKVISFILTWSLVVAVSSCGISVNAQDVGNQAVSLVILDHCDLVEVDTSSNTRNQQQLSPKTMVIGLSRVLSSTTSREGWRVRTLDNPPRTGWVSTAHVTPVEKRFEELKANAVAIRAASSRGNSSPRLPELILLQDDPRIRQAWEEVAVAISENEKLPENERLSEPYFARAEIWHTTKNYIEALSDYLTGIKYARMAERDLLSYSGYLDRLSLVAAELEKVPVPALGVESESLISARIHYGKGCHQYFRGRLQMALDHFDNAIQLAPDQPVHWYFRALAHRRLGDNGRAQHDVVLGAYFERQLQFRRRKGINHSLARVQGTSRTWIESYRLGAPNHSLLRSQPHVLTNTR